MKKTYHLGRKKDHREALLRNLAAELVDHGQVKTTLAKAKALRPVVEHLVTIARRGDEPARRLLAKFFFTEAAVEKMISEVAPKFKSRPGGYTRILKLGRQGAVKSERAMITWVEEQKD